MVRDDMNAAHDLTLHEAALEELPTPILIHDHRSVLYANRAALDVLGAHTHAQIVGRPLSEIVHPDGAAAGATRRTLIMERGHAISDVPVKLVRVDGSVVYAVVSGRPIVYGNCWRAVLVTATLTRGSDVRGSGHGGGDGGRDGDESAEPTPLR